MINLQRSELNSNKYWMKSQAIKFKLVYDILRVFMEYLFFDKKKKRKKERVWSGREGRTFREGRGQIFMWHLTFPFYEWF
jgi:hypothetical protein